MSNLNKEACTESLESISFVYGYLTLEEALDDIRLSGVPFRLLHTLIDERFDNQLTNEEIDFLLMSEEERINKYGLHYAYDLYVSCKEKLERQKEISKDNT